MKMRVQNPNIDEKVLMEFKAKPFSSREDYAQVQRYLSALEFELGILVNFRKRHLIPKRVLRGHSDNSGDIRRLGLRQEGFTLIELIIGMGLGIVLAFALTAIATLGMRHLRIVQEQNRLHSDALFITNTLTHWVKQAEVLETPSATELRVTLPEGGSIRTFTVVDGDFLLDGQPLLREGVDVTSLTFSAYARSARVQIALEGLGGASYDVVTTIAQRNDL